VLLKRLVNVREGWTAAEDTLPARFFDDPLPDGVGKGVRLSRERLAAMIQAYYAGRGLSGDGSIPAEIATAAGLTPLLPSDLL
jgi:aldehyde:ferredoxin oxidoreductase